MIEWKPDSWKELRQEIQDWNKICMICLQLMLVTTHGLNFLMTTLNSIQSLWKKHVHLENIWLMSQYSNLKTIMSLILRNKDVLSSWTICPTEIKSEWWKSLKTPPFLTRMISLIFLLKSVSIILSFQLSETWFWILLTLKIEWDLFLKTFQWWNSQTIFKREMPKSLWQKELNLNNCSNLLDLASKMFRMDIHQVKLDNQNKQLLKKLLMSK